MHLNSEAMLKIGDKVKFLNSVGGGRVTGYASPKVVNVEDDQGFEIPTLITELVKVEEVSATPATRSYETSRSPISAGVSAERLQSKPSAAPVREKETQPLFASSAAKPASAKGAYFIGFVPQVPTMPLSGEIKAWLINDTRHPVLYHLALLSDNEYQSEKSGKLAAYSRVPLKGFTHEDLSHFPAFGFQIMPAPGKSAELKKAVVATVRVNPVKFYKETIYIDNSYFEQRAYLVGIGEDELDKKLEALRNFDFASSPGNKNQEKIEVGAKRRPVESDIREIDLHIHELIDNTAGLSTGEMLELQMSNFRREMERAVKDGVKRIVFIHGVGQGTLKNELRRELSSKFKKFDYQDASFREYGYGATMVMLRN